ncbi:hypothetical protein L914_02023 [Phytophthora nicotianae]|uniref:Uncharacterized protein n=1 Tax=Phytophthora nicotianae TaxID=4792 RepID=W2P1V3_PHYNI|nr:hypothetical protein L914_02023 [Phytophthora nicotianae]
MAKASCRRPGKKPKATPNSGNTDHESESDSAAVSAPPRSHDDEVGKEDEEGEAEGVVQLRKLHEYGLKEGAKRLLIHAKVVPE